MRADNCEWFPPIKQLCLRNIKLSSLDSFIGRLYSSFSAISKIPPARDPADSCNSLTVRRVHGKFLRKSWTDEKKKTEVEAMHSLYIVPTVARVGTWGNQRFYLRLQGMDKQHARRITGISTVHT